MDYETIDRGKDNSSNMLMVSVSGTLVRVAKCSPVIGVHGCSKAGIKGSYVIPAKAGTHLHIQTNGCLPAQA